MTRQNSRWQDLLGDLADELADAGALTDPAWRKAFTKVPRHVFVPGFHSDDGRWVSADDPGTLARVYSDDTLAVQQLPADGQPGSRYVTSSSTRPGYMLWMLHLLDVRDGMSVLEIGTGTGYNAALLSARLGDRNVTSLDIDPALIALARERLAQAGYHPHLAPVDGTGGYPARAPYDRIIATVAMPRLPYPWIRQTRPGGMILADLRPAGMIRAGALASLTVHEDGTAAGRLIDGGVGFMSARTDVTVPAVPNVPVIDKTTVRRRGSDLPGEAVMRPGLAFALWRRLSDLAVFPRPDRVMMTVPDGAWVEVTRTSPAQVEYGGPADLWATVEDTAHWWQENGEPAVDAYDITVTPDGEHITLRTDRSSTTK